MTVRQEEKIFSYTIHIKGRVVLHHLEIKRGEQVRTAKRTAGVPALYAMYHFHNVPAYLDGHVF